MSCIEPQKFKEYQDVLGEYLSNKEGISVEMAENLAYEDWKQFFFENSSMKEAQVFSQIANDDGSIDVRFNSSYKSVKMKLVAVEDDGRYYTISLQNPSTKKVFPYRFLHGQQRSVDVVKEEGSKPQHIRIDTLGYALGNSDNVNINSDLYTKQELDLLNNTENSLVMLDKLTRIDGNDISTEHKNRLSNVLQMFVNTHKKLIPKMNVYINEQAEKVGGVLQIGDAPKLKEGVYLGIDPLGERVSSTDISNSEMYVEEITHAGTAFAIANGGPEAQTALRRIQQLRDQVREQLWEEYKEEPWKVFLPKESIDAVYEEKQAKKMWEYIFENEDTGIEEFIAKGLTWEVFADKLDKMTVRKPKEKEPENLFQAIIHWLGKLFQTVDMKYQKESFETTATDVLVKMSARLAEANNTAMKQTDNKKFLEQTFDRVEDLDQLISSKLKKFIAEKQDITELPKEPKVGDPKWKWVVYLGKMLPYMIGNKTGQIAVKELMHAIGLKYGGDVQTLFNQMLDKDRVAIMASTLRRLSENLDRDRETTAGLVAEGLVDGFKKLSKKEKEAITLAGLDVDLQSIYDDFDVSMLLSDDKVLEKEIKNLRRQIRSKAISKEVGNYYVAQALELGYYMGHHQSLSTTQLFNATLIAKGHNIAEFTKMPEEVDPELVKLIDQLATMEGLINTPEEAKIMLAEIIEREPQGMGHVMRTSRGIIEESKKKTFSNELGMIKGYTKEIFDPDSDVVIRPVKDQAKMAKEGYKLVVKLKKAPGDTSISEMAMYTTKYHAQQNLKKGALRYTDLHSKGTGIYKAHEADREMLAAERSKINVQRIEAAGIRELKAKLKGTYDFSKATEKSLVPKYGKNGKVVDYRYMMSKQAKREYLKQDISAPIVLGRTLASINDKVDTKEHNNKVFDAIVKDMRENYNPRTGMAKSFRERHRYYKLEADSPNKEIREVWKILPKHIKDKMRSEKMDYLAVRADLFKAYFGMRDWGLFDLVGNIPLVGQLVDDITPTQVKYAARVAEEMWANVVNLAKVNIIIKIPEVLIRNIISNIMIAPMHGHPNILKVAKLQVQGAKGLKDYVDKTHELIKLQHAKIAGNPNNLDLGRIKSIEEDLKKHQVADLINEGMFQAIVEEIGKDEKQSANRLARAFDNQLAKAPGWVRNGTHMLFLTEKTKYFKLMTTATQFSDFASRYALYELEKEKQLRKLGGRISDKGMIRVGEIPYFEIDSDKNKFVSRKKAEEMLLGRLKEFVLNVHVDYGDFDGPILEWANKTGLAMFTKYAFRIQKPNIKAMIDHPLHYFSTIGLQYFTGNIDDISDALGGHLNKFGNTSAFTGLIDDLPIYQVYKNVTY